MMQSNRRLQAQEKLGLNDSREQADLERRRAREEGRIAVKQAKKMQVESLAEYKTLKSIYILMDQYYLDPIIGLIPGLGDIVTAFFAIPFLHVSASKIKSLPLTLAILYNVMLDAFVGMIPFYIGNVLDIFVKCHKKNFRLIVGFIEDDKNIIREVNRKAVKSAIGIAVFLLLIYLLISFIASTIRWILDLL